MVCATSKIRINEKLFMVNSHLKSTFLVAFRLMQLNYLVIIVGLFGVTWVSRLTSMTHLGDLVEAFSVCSELLMALISTYLIRHYQWEEG